jgi:hypothetical protein
MKVWLVALVVASIASCSSTHGTGPGSGSIGPPPGPPPPPVSATTCDQVKPRVEQLYRAEAQAKEPKRVDESVADNTAMVMKDCAKDPGKTVPCLGRAASVAELEKQCLIPLDDEGTEGEALGK